MLDGGFTQWNLRGYPVTAAPAPVPKEGTLTVRLHPEYLVDARYVGEHLNAPEMQLLDARAKERYTGETEPIDPVAGHIPGARNRWFKENFAPDGRLKSRAELRAEFERAGLDSKRPCINADPAFRRPSDTLRWFTPGSRARASTTDRGANGSPIPRAPSRRDA